MNSTVLAFLLLGASTCLNAQSRMFSFIRERCGSCHDWANGMGGVEGYVEEINLRLNERDPHIVGRLDGGELLLLSRFCKISLRGDKPRGKVERDEIKSEFSVEYRKPKDTISKGVEPFTPCELGCDDPLPDRDRKGGEGVPGHARKALPGVLKGHYRLSLIGHSPFVPSAGLSSCSMRTVTGIPWRRRVSSSSSTTRNR